MNKIKAQRLQALVDSIIGVENAELVFVNKLDKNILLEIRYDGSTMDGKCRISVFEIDDGVLTPMKGYSDHITKRILGHRGNDIGSILKRSRIKGWRFGGLVPAKALYNLIDLMSCVAYSTEEGNVFTKGGLWMDSKVNELRHMSGLVTVNKWESKI